MRRAAKKRRSKKTALPPGSLVHIGEQKVEEARITQICFDETHFEERVIQTLEADCAHHKPEPLVTWINVDGVHNADAIERIGRHFGLHPLMLEDVMNTDQRPKVEEYDDCLYIVLKMLYLPNHASEVLSEQVSLVLGRNYVISFQEAGEDPLLPIRDRLRSGKGQIRKGGADYLAYAILDTIVDNYFPVLERIGDRLDALEADLLSKSTAEPLQAISSLSREVIYLRKAVWPVREVLARMERGGTPLIGPSTIPYLRDVYDHVIEAVETIDMYRDLLDDLLNVSLSLSSHRANEVMKFLTMLATIFIPLTFVVGIYGMNFDYMPELRSRWGYPAVMAFMTAVAVGFVVMFKKKRWF
jgi:magnesium transporter